MHLFFSIYVIYNYAYLSCYQQFDTYPFDNQQQQQPSILFSKQVGVG
jgi:hypothetical protein